MNAQDFLAGVAGFTQARTRRPGRAAKLATVNPAHTSGRPRVTFDGESTLSVKAYPHAASYTPAAGDRVVLIPVGNTYLILDRVV